MVSTTRRFCSGLPEYYPAVLLVAAALVGFVALDQVHWWRLKPDYAFGWLVPVFALYVMYERWGKLRQVAGAAGNGGGPAGFWKVALAVVAGCVFAAGCLVFLFGAVYRAGAGASQPGSLALALGLALLVPGMIYFSLPPGRLDAGRPWSLRNDVRLRVAALFVFPAAIWLLSAPLLSAVENAVSLFMLRRVVAVVFAVFNLIGLPLIQEGNVLVLPHGQVGVADACSGIRSLMGCLFAGTFLSAVFLDRFWKKLLLVTAAVVFAFFTNLLRSLFLTAWAYQYGSEAIEGTLHDATGYVVLGLTSLGLFCLLPLFRGSNWRRWLGLGSAESIQQKNTSRDSGLVPGGAKAHR